MREDDEPPRAKLMRLITGYRITQALYVVTKLRIADHLVTGPKNAGSLAEELDLHSDELFRVLRALASIGVFAMDKTDRFSLTPISQLLRTDVPGSLAAFTVFQGEEPYHAFGDLLHSMKNGEIAFNHVYGMGHFDYLGKNPDAHSTFNQSMIGGLQASEDLFKHYDFINHKVVVDIGGGHGSLITSILNAHPNLRGILFDLPAAVSETLKFLAQAGVSDRCEIITGSAFEFIPAGGDVYILSRVLHDWPDNQAVVLIKNCRKVIPEDGVLLLYEGIIPEENVPPNRAQLDLMMMVMNGGRERTEKEWQTLLHQGGFALTRVWKKQANQDLIEAKPI